LYLLVVYLVGVAVGGYSLRLVGFVSLAGAVGAVFALVLLVLGGVLLGVAANLTRPPARTHSGMLGWVLAVELGGLTSVAVAAYRWTDAGLSGPSVVTGMLCGIPFAVIAGLWLPGPVRWLCAAAAVAMLVAGAALIHRADQRTARQDQQRGDRALLYVTAVPGYRFSRPPSNGRLALTPAGHGGPIAGHDILVQVSSVYADPIRMPSCGEHPILDPAGRATSPDRSSPGVPRSPGIRCQVEEPGLWYRAAGDRHEYIQLHGDVVIRASASTAVNQFLLRQAIRNAYPATDADLQQWATGTA
jgi:hypothetical protein